MNRGITRCVYDMTKKFTKHLQANELSTKVTAGKLMDIIVDDGGYIAV